MRHLFLKVLLFIVLLKLVSCNNYGNYKIDPQSKYKLIHYVPSQDCIDCYMKFMVPR